MQIKVQPFLRDVQEQPPCGWCSKCGAELYSYDTGDFCPKCIEDMKSNEAIIRYASIFPERLFNFLSSEKDENYIQPFFQAFREYCVGTDETGQDIDDWLKEASL